MRTGRMWLIGIVTAALLLGGAVACDADDDGDGRVTLKVVEVLEEEPGVWRTVESHEEMTGYLSRATVDASDDRLSGIWTVTETWHARCIEDTPDGCEAGEHLVAASLRVENDGGTWLGRRQGYESAFDRWDQTVLEGQGGYAGLTAVLDYEQGGVTGVKGIAGEGVIAGVELPAFPELPEE
jgi:hypothetical protein